MAQFKVFWKKRRGMPLIPARDLVGNPHAVEHAEFPNQTAALQFVQTIVRQGGEAIMLKHGDEKIAAGLELERLAFGR